VGPDVGGGKDVEGGMAGEDDDGGGIGGAGAEGDGDEGTSGGFQVELQGGGGVAEIGGSFFGGDDGPFGFGDELADPGDAVGEIEEEEFAMRADALDDLSDAIEEEHVGLPAVFGDEDAFDEFAGDDVVEVFGEGACLGAFHRRKITGYRV